MAHLMQFLKRHSLVSGFLLMFLLTWPIDLANSKVLPIQVPFAVYILVGYGLFIAALIMTGLTLGRKDVLALLKRFLIWRVSWQWYLVALLLLPCLYVLAVGMNSLLTQTPPDFHTVFAYKIFGESASLPVLILPYFLFDALTNGEEMGWRGYALPRLQSNHSPLTASLMLAVVWWLWHLPKFLAPGNSSSFPLFLVEMLPKAVLYTWLYNHTRGSLLLVTLLHATGNTAGMFLPVANTQSGSNLGVLIIFIVLEFFVVLPIVIRERSAWLSVPTKIHLQPAPR